MSELDLKAKTWKRLKTSAESGLRTDAELQEADAAVNAASIAVFNSQQALINFGMSVRREDMEQLPQQQNIQFLGLPKSLTENLDPKTTTANLLPLTAPFDGTVIERNAVVGEIVEPSNPCSSFPTQADVGHLGYSARAGASSLEGDSR
jgi:multidrug resistance efflux pump